MTRSFTMVCRGGVMVALVYALKPATRYVEELRNLTKSPNLILGCNDHVEKQHV